GISHGRTLEGEEGATRIAFLRESFARGYRRGRPRGGGGGLRLAALRRGLPESLCCVGGARERDPPRPARKLHRECLRTQSVRNGVSRARSGRALGRSLRSRSGQRKSASEQTSPGRWPWRHAYEASRVRRGPPSHGERTRGSTERGRGQDSQHA